MFLEIGCSAICGQNRELSFGGDIEINSPSSSKFGVSSEMKISPKLQFLHFPETKNVWQTSFQFVLRMREACNNNYLLG